MKNDPELQRRILAYIRDQDISKGEFGPSIGLAELAKNVDSNRQAVAEQLQLLKERDLVGAYVSRGPKRVDGNVNELKPEGHAQLQAWEQGDSLSADDVWARIKEWANRIRAVRTIVWFVVGLILGILVLIGVLVS